MDKTIFCNQTAPIYITENSWLACGYTSVGTGLQACVQTPHSTCFLKNLYIYISKENHVIGDEMSGAPEVQPSSSGSLTARFSRLPAGGSLLQSNSPTPEPEGKLTLCVCLACLRACPSASATAERTAGRAAAVSLPSLKGAQYLG